MANGLSHVRIDEGVKRGPRKPRNARDPVTKRFLPVLAPAEHRAAIEKALDRVAMGEELATIAQDIGVTHQAISLWLLDEQPAQYKLAQRRGLIRRILEADEKLETAQDPLALARAREQARFARWDAERRLPGLFGQKQEITHSVSPVLHIHTHAQADGVVIDQQPPVESKG